MYAADKNGSVDYKSFVSEPPAPGEKTSDFKEPTAIAGQSPAAVRLRIQELEKGDFQLWSAYALVLLSLTIGFALLIAPQLHAKHSAPAFLPQLVTGLVVLIVLLNIYVAQKRRKLRSLREELVVQLSARGDQAEELCRVDPLTGVYNRRHLESLLQNETSRSDRGNTPLSIIIADANDFRGVNTKFGHLAGDQLLREIATLLQKTLRDSDTVVRYGGDEFLIVMPDAGEEEAIAALHRLDEAVENWNRNRPAGACQMSLSYGAATYSSGASIDEIVEAADRRMYATKCSPHGRAAAS